LRNDDHKLEHTLVLASSRLLGFFLAISIPVFLSRWLTIQDYGTYKQIILLWMIFLQIQNLGMDLGLFYFVKLNQKHGPLYSLNVTIFNLMSTYITVLLLHHYGHVMADFMHNPGLVAYLSEFSWLLLFSIPAQHFEHYLMSLGMIKWTVITESIHEFLKAIAIIFGFYYFKSLQMVLQMLVIIYFVRLTSLVAFNIFLVRSNRLSLLSQLTYFKQQFNYGLPLGISRFIATFVYFDKIVVSALFSVTKFTIYSVGCFEIPFVSTILHTVWDVGALEMVVACKNKNKDELITLWHDTMRKISILTIPTFVFCLFFAREIIVTIFSTQYEGSVPYFRLFIFTFLINAFDCELLFRIFRENSRYLKIQIFNLVVTLSMMISLGLMFGPLYALLGKVMANVVISYLMQRNAAKLLNLKLVNVLPYKVISKIVLLCSSVAMLLILILHSSSVSHFYVLVSGFMLFSSIVFILFIVNGIITDEEIKYLRQMLDYKRFFAKQGVM